MARPRTIQLDGGEVSLQGFSKEQSEALSTHIKAFGKNDSNINAGNVMNDSINEVKQEVSISLPSLAIGIDGNDLVTVSYNKVTKEARVEKVENCHGKRDTSLKFKMAADKLKFV